MLYAHLDAFERFLSQDPHLKHGNYVGGSAFQFLIACDFGATTGVLDAQGAITDYFNRNHIAYEAKSDARDLVNLMLSVLPRYVDPNVDWLIARYSKLNEWRGKETSKRLLRSKIAEDFRFLTKPPDWIQSPHWPIGDDAPYIFFGQIKVERFFHDSAAVYVFFEERSGRTENVIQVS